MRRKSHKPYLILFSVLLFLMSVPQKSSETWRGTAIAFLAPFWDYFASMHSTIEISESEDENKQIQKLQIENQSLKSEIVRLREIAQRESYLMKEFTKNSILKTHTSQLSTVLQYQLQAVPASVIYRSPSSWGSSLWLNIGHEDSQIVAKNSPVVVGDSIVGVVDYVGKHQCRVRLITDSGLTPSVRAARKDAVKTNYLAKGELHGSSKPMWRSRGTLLRGIGFNYDFPDEEGPARDLRSGIPMGSSDTTLAIPLLKVNDLLVTTGMDGVFPSGFSVAKVTHVYPLNEGDYYYEIEAKATAGNLHELSYLFVLPPLGYDPDDQPPLIGS